MTAKTRAQLFFIVIVAVLFVGQAGAAKSAKSQATKDAASTSQANGSVQAASTTLLPDGTVLVAGGQAGDGTISNVAVIRDAQSGVINEISATLNFARAWHTASVLPDGTVLIVGGIGADGKIVSQVEVFDPQSQTFRLLTKTGPTPRGFHTATLLTDGRLLLAGGVGVGGEVLQTLELWDPRQGTASAVKVALSVPRRNHVAALLDDGTVLLRGGKDVAGNSLSSGDIFNPQAETITPVANPQAPGVPSGSATETRATSPEDGATGVAVDVLISLRFSRPLLMKTINAQTVALSGPAGFVDAKVVGAEDGMLAFVTPNPALLPGTTYTVTFSGGVDQNNSSAAFTQFNFSTEGELPLDDTWSPTSDWMTHRPDSKWQALPPLHAGAGVTALAGQVLKLDGNPLAHVTLTIDSQREFTDGTGRFLLKNLTAGHHSMMINATTANSPTRSYGIYEVGVDIKAGQTNVLKYTIWMTPLDTAHTVTIPSPTLVETVIKSPLLPGLELHIPANAVITGYDGRVVTQINITPIPLDRPPFPLPVVPVPIYFTIQPGSSYINVKPADGPKGASLFYPNSFGFRPGTQFNFWNYDPDKKGWYIYGQGRVSADASQVIPNPGVVLYEFTGAMVANPNTAPAQGPPPAGKTAPADAPPPAGPPAGPGGSGSGSGSKGGDPIDLATGLFVYQNTDLTVSDVIPLVLSRTYRQNDSISRALGIGTTFPYDIFLIGTNNSVPGGGYVWQDLILADGGRIHFNRISPCTGANGYCDFGDAVFENTSSPTDFFGATIKWTGQSPTPWLLTKKDGTMLFFPDSDGSTSARGAALFGMQDRYGNFVQFTRDFTTSNLMQLTSTNGRWIKFTYDTSNRVTQAQDNIDRVVQYAYDSGGRLSQFTDANGGVTKYTYDAFNEMLTIQDPGGIVYLTNQYDSSGRVVKQTRADNSVFQFSYTIDPITGNITQTDVTDPRGTITRTTFNANGYVTSRIAALGKPEQQTTLYVRDANTNLITSTIDPLQRETDYTYDALGNRRSVTTMAKTSAAATTTFTYDPNFNQIATMTDPLNHTTTYQRDPATGNLTASTDALQHQTTYSYFPNGQLMSTTDPLGNTFQFVYNSGDLVSIIDAMSNMTTLFTDGAGRTVSATDPLGNTTKTAYDALDHVTQVTDPKGGVTTYSYDPNGNLLSLTDALNHTTSWTYDNMDRMLSRTDPLLRQETYGYDLNGNRISGTDRKGQITSATFDALNRPSLVGFNRVLNGGITTYDSTITYVYDGGNRITQGVDTAGGTTTRSYNDLQRVVTETTAQGSLSIAFDPIGNPTSMTVAGQPSISYTYDNANRLTKIAQGTSSVTLAYDNGNRRSSVTLPNGVSMSYSFNNDSHVTGITYQLGTTVLGTLSYAYDQLGRRNQATGSLALTGLPKPVTSTSYDAANELTNWNGINISYDSNGNMLGDTSGNSFTWDARNQVATLNGLGLQYDMLGRRTTNAAGKSFLLNGPNATQELSGSTVTASIWTGGVDEVFQRSDANGTVVPLADVLGSIIALTNSSGAITTTYSYDPFGNTTVAGTASANPSQFTGRENENNGLYYFRARYYSPVLGRFISEDPKGFSAGVNFYAYAGDDPINFSDPFGFDKSHNPLGIRAPGQSWGDCMLQHGQDYSMAGAVDLLASAATGDDPGIRNNFVGSLVGGNHIMGAVAAVAGNMHDGQVAASAALHDATGPAASAAAQIMYQQSFNATQYANPAIAKGAGVSATTALAEQAANLGNGLSAASELAEGFSSILNLGMSLTVRLAVDVALTGAEAFNCSMEY